MQFIQPTVFDALYRDLGWVSYYEVVSLDEEKVDLILHTTIPVEEGKSNYALLEARHSQLEKQLKKKVQWKVECDSNIVRSTLTSLLVNKQ